MDRVRSPVVWAGVLLAIASFFVYWLSNRAFDATRGDLFYLADAFLHGKTNIAVALGPFDVIYFKGLIYVPFAPFPAIVLAPIVALTGPAVADQWETGINAFLAATVVLLRVVGLGPDRRRQGPRPARDGDPARASRPRSGGSRPAAACGTRAT